MTPLSSLPRAAASAGLVATPLLAGAAAADHPAPLRSAEMSPLTLALLSGGLALATALVVLVIVMLLTRKDAPSERAGE